MLADIIGPLAGRSERHIKNRGYVVDKMLVYQNCVMGCQTWYFVLNVIICHFSGGGMIMLDLVPIWKDRGINKDLKMKLVRSLVWIVLTYGAEHWALTKSL